MEVNTALETVDSIDALQHARVETMEAIARLQQEKLERSGYLDTGRVAQLDALLEQHQYRLEEIDRVLAAYAEERDRRRNALFARIGIGIAAFGALGTFVMQILLYFKS